MPFSLDGTYGLIDNYDYQVLPSGFSYTFIGYQTLLLDPSGTLASGTITFPLTPAGGMTIKISTTQAITTLTLNGNGKTIVNPATSLAANQTLTYIYNSVNTKWYASNNTAASSGITAQIQPISAAIASNAITVSASQLTLDFRSTTLTSGAVTLVTGTPANLVIAATDSFGLTTAYGNQRIAILAINNGGTIELAATALANAFNINETNFVTTVVAATASGAVKSGSVRTLVPYRVIGFIDATFTTGTGWGSITQVQGKGGSALDALSSIGYGQIMQPVTRNSGQTYYNTTGRPIVLYLRCQVSTTLNVTINGNAMGQMQTGTSPAINISFIITPGTSYVLAGGYDSVYEIR